ncbi:SOUL family heme-binding protein [Tabrizicola thermarum]|uniref:SOUL family heme-binding protein n=1 Tax=Tabrizicola thermarum TaxID=2670345 RepID=UPI000FFBFA5A|nr:heme-binding protein [Tabrizicola thermarum]
MLKRIILALGVAMATGAGAETTHKGYEMPPYTVDWQDGTREIRSYGPHLLAEVKVSGSRSGAIQKGFRVLAGYIFGGNASSEKIAMTVPVAQTPEPGGETWTVSFMMPARYTTDTLPAPRSEAIRFVKAGPSRQLVERFSGIPGTDTLADRAEALRAWAKRQGHEILAGPHYYFYDAPMTLPWKRRNEVAFTIR